MGNLHSRYCYIKISNIDNVYIKYVSHILGCKPYGNKSAEEAKDYICKEKQHLEIPSNFPSQLSDQLKQCWSYNPENRPDFTTLRICIQQFTNNLKQDVHQDLYDEQKEDDVTVNYVSVNCKDEFQGSRIQQNVDNKISIVTDFI